MRLVIQRVNKASVRVGDIIKSEIQQGLLVLVGVETADTAEDLLWLSNKLVHMRIFEDEAQKMNYSVKDIGGDLLLVSQFTLHASTKKGNRPSFIKAASPEIAVPIYEAFVKATEQELGKPVKTGEFGAMMEISLVNNGPVTIIIDSKQPY
jgi:D-tyrosyl-tRNA(Tyr) deacylase